MDLFDKNPISRIYSSPFLNLKALKLHTACIVLKKPQFKKNPVWKKILNNIFLNINLVKDFLNSKDIFIDEDKIIIAPKKDKELNKKNK